PEVALPTGTTERPRSFLLPTAYCLLLTVRPKLLAPHRRDGGKLSGFLFRQRVIQETPRSRLHAGQILQLVLRAVRRIELDVEMEIRKPSLHRRLVEQHHVGKRKVEQIVV